MVSSGLKKAGYKYLVIDGVQPGQCSMLWQVKQVCLCISLYRSDAASCADAWSNMQRNEDGNIEANSDRFPSGIP